MKTTSEKWLYYDSARMACAEGMLQVVDFAIHFTAIVHRT